MAHQLLLADDSVTIQRVIKLTFADEDVEVVTVGDGNLAVAAIDRQPPDIVLADVAMPGRSGYEVAQHIRTSPRLAHIPVLLLTGAFEPVDEARAFEVGCDGVLAKPFEPEVVISRVKELLAKPRPVAAPVPVPATVPVAGGGTATMVAEAPAPVPAPVRPAPADVDAYFDRLDQAFATLALSPRPAVAAEPSGVDVAPVTDVPASDARPGAAAEPLVEAFAGLAAPSAAQPSSTPTALTDAQVDLIVDRVVATLTARLGVSLSEVVASVAERVVREEIADIKRRV